MKRTPLEIVCRLGTIGIGILLLVVLSGCPAEPPRTGGNCSPRRAAVLNTVALVPGTNGPLPQPPVSPQPPAELPRREMTIQGLHFVEVPAGTFLMGSPPDEPGHGPGESQRSVSMRSFWMSTTEVPQEVYEHVMLSNPSQTVGPRLPVTCVTYDEAVEFCDRLGMTMTDRRFRLPTEEEWEYACRAGSQDVFGVPSTWSSDLRQAVNKYRQGDVDFLTRFVGRTAWFNQGGLCEVGSLAPNGWRLHDMAGNVAEWCAVGSDPLEMRRPIRGGSWASTDVLGCRCAARGFHAGELRKDSIGIRVVMEGP